MIKLDYIFYLYIGDVYILLQSTIHYAKPCCTELTT